VHPPFTPNLPRSPTCMYTLMLTLSMPLHNKPQNEHFICSFMASCACPSATMAPCACHLSWTDAAGTAHVCASAPSLAFFCLTHSLPQLLRHSFSCPCPTLLVPGCSCPQHTSRSTCMRRHETSTQGARFMAPYTCAAAQAQPTGACSRPLSLHALSLIPSVPHPFVHT